MLLVASETGHVYTFATRKLQPMITSDAGKALIQTCLNSPDPPNAPAPNADQRMSASGYEETELTYNAIADAAAAAAAADAAEQQKVRQMMYNSHHYPLFSPGGAPGTPVSSHAGAQAPPSSHYTQPAPSPSPHQVGGVSTTSGHAPSSSYSPSHHSPPFLGSMGQQARWLAPGEESYSWPTPPSLYPGYGWTKPTLTPSPPPGSVSSRFEDAEEKWGFKSLVRAVTCLVTLSYHVAVFSYSFFYLYITMSNQVYFQTLVFDIVHAPITISACQARPLFLMQKLINAAMPRLLSISLLILYLESLPKLISFFIGYVFIRLRLSDREF